MNYYDPTEYAQADETDLDAYEEQQALLNESPEVRDEN